MKILVVDDELVSRMKLQKILGVLGDCQVVESGKAALAAFERSLSSKAPFDLMTLDIAMPGMDGLEVLTRIRKAEAAAGVEKPLKALMVTSHKDKETVVRSARSGASGYITKPFNKETVLQNVAKLGFKGVRKQLAGAQYDAVVHEYFAKNGGVVIFLSDDNFFYKTLKSVIQKTLGVTHNCVFHFMESAPALKEAHKYASRKIPCLVFAERVMRGKLTTEFIMQVKHLTGPPKIIVLTTETQPENLIYLHDVGVDNILTKPASANNLIQKMAFTIKPQGKLGQIIDKAKKLLAEGKYDKVVEASDQILEIKPDSPAGLMLRGDAMAALGRNEEAVLAFEDAHESSTLFLEPLKRLAELYKETDHERYLHYLKKLDEISPLNTGRKTEIGRVHVRRGEMGEAETYFDKAMEQARSEAHGMIANVANDVAEAVADASPQLSEKFLTQALAIKGDKLSRADMPTFNRLGIVLRRQGKWQEAIDNYQKALRIIPDDENLHYNLAMAFADGTKYYDALKSLDNALAISPRFYEVSATVCYNIANIHAQLKQDKDAWFYLNKALEISPNHASARKLRDEISGKA